MHKTITSLNCGRILVTGAFDCVIRLWNRDNGSLLSEIRGHKSNINSIIFDRTGSKMFSADGAGIIKVWTGRMDSSGSSVLFEPLSTVTAVEV